MLTRNENGKLEVSSLDLEIFFSDLFEKCKSEKEVEWVREQIQGCADVSAEERLMELE